MNKKRNMAFTLAEVLITLGIIGVVAALTIPTLIQEYQKIVFVTRLKKSYSEISQAIKFSEVENGLMKDWDLGTEYTKDNLKRVVDTYFTPYFKKSKVYELTATTSYGTYGIILANGTVLGFELDGSSSEGLPPSAIDIYTDFKGRTVWSANEKKDYSKETFVYRIDGRRILHFFEWGLNPAAPNREQLINHPTYGCNKNIAKNRRFNCGALIQMDGWEIKDDYPW